MDIVCVSGRNDGSVKGVRYFRCRKRHGMFVRHDRLVMDKKRSVVNATRTSMTRKSTGNLSVGGRRAESTSSGSPRMERAKKGRDSMPSYMRSTFASNKK